MITINEFIGPALATGGRFLLTKAPTVAKGLVGTAGSLAAWTGLESAGKKAGLISDPEKDMDSVKSELSKAKEEIAANKERMDSMQKSNLLNKAHEYITTNPGKAAGITAGVLAAGIAAKKILSRKKKS